MNLQSVKSYVKFHQPEIVGYVVTPAICVGVFLGICVIVSRGRDAFDPTFPKMTDIEL